MGDEVRRTQQGNNNVYCQDNALAWFDWRGVEQHADLLRFARRLIRFNRENRVFQEERFWTAADGHRTPRLTWHGTRLGRPDWGDESHSLAFSLHDETGGGHFHVMLNAYWQPLLFELPPLPRGQHWHRAVDTSLASPDDFCEPDAEPLVAGNRYRLEARSCAILLARA
jgi:glycogen operon protein